MYGVSYWGTCFAVVSREKPKGTPSQHSVNTGCKKNKSYRSSLKNPYRSHCLAVIHTLNQHQQPQTAKAWKKPWLRCGKNHAFDVALSGSLAFYARGGGGGATTFEAKPREPHWSRFNAALCAQTPQALAEEGPEDAVGGVLKARKRWEP